MNPRVVLAGGGLANGLLALRLHQTRPDVEVVLLERGAALGGNHVWCFHDSDLEASQREWVAPLVERSWPGYEVRFPERRRRLPGGYNAITSERLHRVVSAALGTGVRTGSEIARVTPRAVFLADGSSVEGAVVIDGRGDSGSKALSVAFQKFLGQCLELDAPHGLAEPILMDATVPQRDGFRFLYTLPFDERTLHVEDTVYSDTASLDDNARREAIARYAEEQGWRVRRVLREERGVLPIVLEGDIRSFWAEAEPGVARAGVRAALFHPTTGYSLPEAVRLADDLARWPLDDGAEVARRVRKRSLRLWRRDGFLRLLNRLLFRAADPERRFLVLQRFYGLPEGLIRRFYAGGLTATDRLRILAGRPPVPLRRALRYALPGRVAAQPTPGVRP